jgi:drug/metabolite transporter (DMT)-like permease
MTNTARGTVEMTAAMAISGTIGWFVVVSGQAVMDVVFWRCAFGAATLLIVCATMGLLRKRLPLRILGLAALGGAAIVINWLLLFAAYSRASISIATAIYNTQPFMLVGLGALLFAERLTATKLTWLGIAFAGTVLIVQAKPDTGLTGTNYLAGILMALGAAFFYAIAAIVAKALKGTKPHLIALIQVCVGILMLAPFANLSSLPTDRNTWAILIIVGVIHTGLMYILLYGAIQKLPTALTGALSFIYPVVAILVDLTAFGHRLQPAQIIGATAILIAAAGMTLGWSLWREKTPVSDGSHNQISEACPEIGQCHHQDHRIERRRLEADPLVE